MAGFLQAAKPDWSQKAPGRLRRRARGSRRQGAALWAEGEGFFVLPHDATVFFRHLLPGPPLGPRIPATGGARPAGHHLGAGAPGEDHRHRPEQPAARAAVRGLGGHQRQARGEGDRDRRRKGTRGPERGRRGPFSRVSRACQGVSYLMWTVDSSNAPVYLS